MNGCLMCSYFLILSLIYGDTEDYVCELTDLIDATVTSL